MRKSILYYNAILLFMFYDMTKYDLTCKYYLTCLSQQMNYTKESYINELNPIVVNTPAKCSRYLVFMYLFLVLDRGNRLGL